jgi:hypothetical protein
MRQRRQSPPPKAEPALDLEDLVNRWFRPLARRWHPDCGGSDTAMHAINDAHDWLRELLGLNKKR